MSSALHSAESVEHYTPEPIVEAARYTLGGTIALDPASSEFANRVVKAKTIFTGPPDGKDGLAQQWWGPLFLNPPGKSKTNPGGQAAWWKKLMDEYDYWLGSYSAVFIGFSLELLQTAQRYPNTPQPLDFPVCIPEKRIRFDVRTDDLAKKLHRELPYIGMDPHDYCDQRVLDTLTKEQQKKAKQLIYCLANPDTRVSGDSPTHGNIIVCLSSDADTKLRFRESFGKFGRVFES